MASAGDSHVLGSTATGLANVGNDLQTGASASGADQAALVAPPTSTIHSGFTTTLGEPIQGKGPTRCQTISPAIN